MTRADKLLTLTIFLVAIAGLTVTYRQFLTSVGQPERVQAVISVQGRVVRTIDLHSDGKRENLEISGRLGPAAVEISNGRIRIHSAPCLQQICVRQGWIAHPGESIICLPGEMVIRVNGQTPVDAVTR